MKISFVVLTSVTRDDIPDGGASQFRRTVEALRSAVPGIQVEALVPDFQGSNSALREVLASGICVLNHNVETVPRLYPTIRFGADYGRSLRLLAGARAHSQALVIKSGLMLGLGETRGEVTDVLRDLRKTGCEILTLGQYLQPGRDKAPVSRYIHPSEFARLREEGLAMGFREVVSGPFVRSSFQAEEACKKVLQARGS